MAKKKDEQHVDLISGALRDDDALLIDTIDELQLRLDFLRAGSPYEPPRITTLGEEANGH